MPWHPLPRIAFAVATYPFAASSPADLPLEIGDELYIIEETPDGNWLRGYLVAPPSLLAGLTSVKGQTLEARVFSGIFPRSCVEVRELLGESDETDENDSDDGGLDASGELVRQGSDSAKGGLGSVDAKRRREKSRILELPVAGIDKLADPKGKGSNNGTPNRLSIAVHRDPEGPRPPAPVPMLKIGDETPTSVSEPLIDEIASCLREWHSTNLHGLLLARQYHKLDRLSQLISTLNFSRQQFLHNVLTTWEYTNLREKTVWDLVRVNKLCGGEVIVRDPRERGRVLTGDDSVVEITKLQSVMSLLDESPQPPVETTALHHLLVDIKGFAGSSFDAPTLVFHLARKDSSSGELSRVSESYQVEVPAGGAIGGLTKTNQLKALFADLSASDIGEAPSAESELFLIVKVNTPQQVPMGKPSSRSGPVNHAMPSHSKDSTKPPLSMSNKSVRRSLMWGGKSTRSAFSRGGGGPKLDSLAEEQPSVAGQESRDGPPPSTANSRGTRWSIDMASDLIADRTVGLGVMKLNAIMKQQEEVEHVITIWTPADKSSDKNGGAVDTARLVQDLVSNNTGHLEKSKGSERLQVALRPFNHPDADALIKSTPTLLSGVCKTNKMGFSGAPTKPRSDIYLTIDAATLSKHATLSKYGGGGSAVPNAAHLTNLQVTLEVRRASGERIDNCIFSSANGDGMSMWKSVAVDRDGSWDQTVRLLLAQQDVFTAHVVMFIAEMPNPPFAVAHMPLWDQKAFVADGMHPLLLYKVDEYTATPKSNMPPGNKGGYLSLQWAANTGQADVTGPMAVLRTTSYLCSTRFSQDRSVLGLIKWKEAEKEEIPTLLNEIVFVPEIEIVKLLNDVLDALFAILCEHSGNDELEDLVFNALVRVLDIVHDRRFNLGPLLDQYADTRFSYPSATACLVRSFNRLLNSPEKPEAARKLRATFKVVRHILKFITAARGQQIQKEAIIGITGPTPGFTRHLQTIFKGLDSLMKQTSPALVGSQTLAVQHFHTWLPELTSLLSTDEIIHIAIDFMDSCSQVKGKLLLYKLVLIINYSKLEVFSHPDQRSVLSANTVRWIAPHWGYTDTVTEQWKEQVRLCCSILASQIDHLAAEIPDHLPKIMQSYGAIKATPRRPKPRLSLLFPTQYPFPSRPSAESATFDEALIELSAVLSSLINSPSGMQLELGEDELHIILENTLSVHMSILQGEAFPSNWLSVHIFHHKSAMKTLEYLANILLESFLPHPDDAENFSTELWKLFFSTLLKLVGSSSLALETFPEQKRRAVWKIAGDVREHGAELLRRTWEAIGWETSVEERARYNLTKLGGYQVQYVPTLVGPIVELCLSVHEGLRRMAVEVLQTMIVSEWTLSEDLSIIQAEIIDCLDVYVGSKPLTESILQKLFVGELLQRFEPLSQIEGDPLYAALGEVMGTIDEFLDLLVAVHGGDGSRSGEATHLIHRLRLMEFLRDMQKEEIFVRYVHQLAQIQADARNPGEAGLALRLHADLYDWDPTKMTPALTDPDFPAQSEFERKERIYFDMIKHFEDGAAWSSALVAYKELQTQYETNIYDFSKLARTERAIATIYETLAKSEKLVPKYYKVIFRGLGFPVSARDKEFIYEGSPHERASMFTERIQEQYPSAQIVTSENLDDVEGQFLIISAISPHRDLTHNVFQRSRVPQPIREYLVSANPQSFSVTSRRSTAGPVAEHFAEKVVYVTAEPFPTILRRSEIVETHEVRLDANETALERIVRKTQEMSGVEKRVLDGEGGKELAQLLVDAVSISVNPNSENSVACYRELIKKSRAKTDGENSDEEELDDEAEDSVLEPQENAIKMALVDHAMMLKRVLANFAKSSNEILARHHADLQQYFESTFAPEIALFAPPPQPPRENNNLAVLSPTWSRSSGLDTMSPNVWNNPLSPLVTTVNGVPHHDESVTIMQPVSLRQGKGARLSFLSGRKKDVSPTPTTPVAPIDENHPLAQQQQHQETPNSQGRPQSHAQQHPPQSANGYLEAGGQLSRVGSRDTTTTANRRSIFRPLSVLDKHNFSLTATTTSVPANGAGGNDAKDVGSDWLTEYSYSGTTGAGQGGGGGGAPRPSLDGRPTDPVAAAGGKDGGAGVKLGGVRKRLSILRMGRKGNKTNAMMGSVDEE